ncbi:hypothetical protein KIL84_018475 [Mauremys mutica]|uniref:Uncharacterized protein n=1 Tax=Mauremys mutica TaxID=74926 RepID=A0A9D3XT74_9SAUR|nr:hypothetical protein KIL84_018475 [Mauremys mutica]
MCEQLRHRIQRPALLSETFGVWSPMGSLKPTLPTLRSPAAGTHLSDCSSQLQPHPLLHSIATDWPQHLRPEAVTGKFVARSIGCLGINEADALIWIFCLTCDKWKVLSLMDVGRTSLLWAW